MHHGKRCDCDVALPQAVALGDVRPAETEVAVGQHDALRVPRCAGGVEHDRRIVGIGWPLPHRYKLPSRPRCDRRLDGLGPPPQDDAAETRHVTLDLIHEWSEIFLGYEQRRFRIVEEIRHFPGGIQWVYGHDDAPRLDDAVEGDERLAAVRMENRHMVPGSYAEPFETRSDPVRDGIEFPVRDRPPLPVDEDPAAVPLNPFFEKPNEIHHHLLDFTGLSVPHRCRWSGP